MAVNHVDGILSVSILFYPIAALLAAIKAGAGGFAIIFFLVACPLGYYYVMWSREVLYWMLDLIFKAASGKSLKDFDQNETPGFWLSWILGPPLLLFYLVAPIAIMHAGIVGVMMGTVMIVRHLF